MHIADSLGVKCIVIHPATIPVRFVQTCLELPNGNPLQATKLVFEAFRGQIGLLEAKRAVELVLLAQSLNQ